MTPEQVVWISAAFTALGALIGALATLAAARFTWQRQHHNEAAGKFRAAFVEEIYRLRRGSEDVFRVLTDDVVARQELEKIIFEQFLTHSEIQALNGAWQDYFRSRRTAAPGSLNNRPNEVQRALSQIDQLLSCAKPK